MPARGRARRHRRLLDRHPPVAAAELLRRARPRNEGARRRRRAADAGHPHARPHAEPRRADRRGCGFATTTPVHRMETEDLVCAAVRFESGALGTIEATTAAFPGVPSGSRSSARRAPPRSSAPPSSPPHDGRATTVEPNAAPAAPAPTRWPSRTTTIARDRGFPRCARGRRAPRVERREALKVHRLIDALLAAARAARRCGSRVDPSP